MRKAGKLAAEVLDMIGEYVVPGVTTGELDKICHDFMIAHNSQPATLGYRGYPASSCISINHVVCHGIPSEKKLKEGDILNIDVTAILDGWFGDNSRMYVAGEASVKSKRLMQVTHDSLPPLPLPLPFAPSPLPFLPFPSNTHGLSSLPFISPSLPFPSFPF